MFQCGVVWCGNYKLYLRLGTMEWGEVWRGVVRLLRLLSNLCLWWGKVECGKIK